ncbi:hypothetical protein MRX96_004136 [Rhipicephalus microplus]
MAPTKRKAVSLETKSNILQDLRRGFKVSALVKKYELAQSTISTILKSRKHRAFEGWNQWPCRRAEETLYRRRMLEWLVLTIDRSAPGTSGNAGGPSDAPDLKISLLKAVRFVYGAWYEVRPATIQNCFRKAGFVRQDQPPSSSDSDSVTGTETADLTELWEHVATVDADSGCVASVEDFLTADSAASFCDELTDEAIVADVLSRQAAALCDGSDSSDEEVDSASTTPSMTTQEVPVTLSGEVAERLGLIQRIDAVNVEASDTSWA